MKRAAGLATLDGLVGNVTDINSAREEPEFTYTECDVCEGTLWSWRVCTNSDDRHLAEAHMMVCCTCGETYPLTVLVDKEVQ